MLYKKCSKCKKRKSIKDFYTSVETKDGFQTYCKQCFSIYHRSKYKSNPTKPEKTREYDLKTRYNLTIKDYNQILRKQNYKCAICGKHYKMCKRNLSVDHNHQTGHVRGLLCIFCNGRLLRYFHDNKNRAVGLIKYLQNALKMDKKWK